MHKIKENVFFFQMVLDALISLSYPLIQLHMYSPQ